MEFTQFFWIDSPATRAALSILTFVAIGFFLRPHTHRSRGLHHLYRQLQGFGRQKRVAAAESLRFFPSDATRLALSRALRDRSIDVRLAAAGSLAKVGAAPQLDDLLPPLSRHTSWTPERLTRLLGDYCEHLPNAVIALARDVKQPPRIRVKAIEALAAAGDRRHAAAVQNLVLTSEPEIRVAVLRALAKLSNSRSRDAVTLCLRDKSWFVRATAADTAGALGMQELVPLIVSLMDDEHWWVSFRASEALEKLDTAGRTALRRIAKQGSPRQRRQAALTLTKRVVA